MNKQNEVVRLARKEESAETKVSKLVRKGKTADQSNSPIRAGDWPRKSTQRCPGAVEPELNRREVCVGTVRKQKKEYKMKKPQKDRVDSGGLEPCRRSWRTLSVCG